MDCDFERGNCNWSIDPEKSYIWTLSSGSTSSHNTGPDNDHTTGLSKRLQYCKVCTAQSVQHIGKVQLLKYKISTINIVSTNQYMQ